MLPEREAESQGERVTPAQRIGDRQRISIHIDYRNLGSKPGGPGKTQSGILEEGRPSAAGTHALQELCDRRATFTRRHGRRIEPAPPLASEQRVVDLDQITTLIKAQRIIVLCCEHILTGPGIEASVCEGTRNQ